LNKSESIELVRPVLAQGRKELLENWLKVNILLYFPRKHS